MKLYTVYILKCNDNTFYTGITNNLERRLAEHKTGENPNAYTYKRRPLKLVYFTEFTDVEFAIEAEKQIKKWSQAKKKELIEGNFDLLKILAKKKFKN